VYISVLVVAGGRLGGEALGRGSWGCGGCFWGAGRRAKRCRWYGLGCACVVVGGGGVADAGCVLAVVVLCVGCFGAGGLWCSVVRCVRGVLRHWFGRWVWESSGGCAWLVIWWVVWSGGGLGRLVWTIACDPPGGVYFPGFADIAVKNFGYFFNSGVHFLVVTEVGNGRVNTV
jgi:hypothetical protein